MYQGTCSGNISASRILRSTRGQLTLDDFLQVATLSRLSASPNTVGTSFTMPTPPQTPDMSRRLLTESSCTSAERSSFYPLDEIACPDAVREYSRPSRNPSSKRKHDEAHVRRPANPFILFACEYRKQFIGQKRNNRELSSEAGMLWKSMSESRKELWRTRARAVKEQHAEEHPGYRYKPRRRVMPRQDDIDSRRNQITTAVVLPPTPISIPRRSTDIHGLTNHVPQLSRESMDSAVHPSILNSPTRHAAKSDAKPRCFTELLPQWRLAPSQHGFAESEAGPGSTSVHNPSELSNDCFQSVTEPWMNCNQPVPYLLYGLLSPMCSFVPSPQGQQWDYNSFYAVNSADWNSQTTSDMEGRGTKPQNLPGSSDNAQPPSYYGQHTIALPEDDPNALASYIQEFVNSISSPCGAGSSGRAA
ncbi:uncharacterized protein FOMMEDRAFT_28113 [Fomitiporia mediterranea MF3/22]|uniref:uncharacterized protein n=1 Tax=Fomitiporia mediterranea (strain MF3/22) TaxID=694068 RepID=UPI0004408203|nr:uncharacterized protein FOMMEDRAFT_28113 [Fomitiporia mediterranea MF3/22]EJD04412.1 hypothetical protein FOMMEDRAFT_28113 [Fomitiporia mediterranea MF3/22]